MTFQEHVLQGQIFNHLLVLVGVDCIFSFHLRLAY